MTATLIDGTAIAAAIRAEIKTRVDELFAASGRRPGLATVLVGEDPASQAYVRMKGKNSVEVGMESFSYKLPATASQEEVEGLVAELNANPAVNGILVQLPAAQAPGRRGHPGRDQPGEGRGRLPPGQHRPAGDEGAQAALHPLHAQGLPGAAAPHRRQARRRQRRGAGPQQHRRHAGGRCCCCTPTPPSPPATRAARTCPASAARPTCWWPPWAGPRWSRPTGSSRARW